MRPKGYRNTKITKNTKGHEIRGLDTEGTEGHGDADGEMWQWHCPLP